MKPTKRQIISLIKEKNWVQLGILIRSGVLNPNWTAPAVEADVRLLTIAIEYGAEELAIQLINAGANVNYIENDGLSPLMKACQFRLHGVIEALIKAGADVNMKASKCYESGNGGHTALIMAAEQSDLWAVRRLIRAGADVNAVTRFDESALFWAGFGGGLDCYADLSVAKELVKAGVQWRGNELHIPVLRRDVRMVKFFVESGCPVNGQIQFLSKDRRFVGIKKGDTPLMIAVRKTIREMFNIEAGPVFHHAIQRAVIPKRETLADLNRRRAAIIKFLLEKGADPTIPNAEGETVHDIASRLGDTLALRYLKKFSTGKPR